MYIQRAPGPRLEAKLAITKHSRSIGCRSSQLTHRAVILSARLSTRSSCNESLLSLLVQSVASENRASAQKSNSKLPPPPPLSPVRVCVTYHRRVLYPTKKLASLPRYPYPRGYRLPFPSIAQSTHEFLLTLRLTLSLLLAEVLLGPSYSTYGLGPLNSYRAARPLYCVAHTSYLYRISTP